MSMSFLSSIDSKMLNLVFSSALLFIGLAVYWFWHPRRFQEHGFLERAFEFWVLKWLLFVVTYGLLKPEHPDLRFVLATIDLNTTIGIGFVVTLWRGDSYDARRTQMNLLFFFGLLFAWNFVSRDLSHVLGGRIWILPSMTFSLLTLLGMGVVVFIRYGKAALGFLAVSAAYALLQMPGYQTLFLDASPDKELLTWLAFGKLLYGAMFYATFLSPVLNFDVARLPRLPSLSGRAGKAVTWVLVTVGGGVLTEATLWLGKLVWRKLTGHSV